MLCNHEVFGVTIFCGKLEDRNVTNKLVDLGKMVSIRMLKY